MAGREVLPRLLRAATSDFNALVGGGRASTRLVSQPSFVNSVRHYARGASSNLRNIPASLHVEEDEEGDDYDDGGQAVGKPFDFKNRAQQHQQKLNTKKTAKNVPYERPFKHIVVPGKISPRLPIPEGIVCPPYAHTDGKIKPYAYEGPFEIKGPKSIQGMREACSLAKKILDFAGTLVKPGVTTDEIDRKVHAAIIDSGAYPSPLNYHGYPKSISVNEVAAHGIPDDRPLVDGDIISIDITVFYKGFHGDNCATFFVGEMVDERAKRLVRVAREVRDAGIAILRPGIPVAAIGAAMQNEAMKHKMPVIPDLTGHGIGRVFHQRPYILPCRNDYRGILEPGMTFTIEPIVCEKHWHYSTWDDKWTMVTKDGGWTAQFEHTVLITDTGAEILTL